MGRGGWRIARIAGIDVRADVSLAFLAILLTYDLGAFFSDRFRFPELSSGSAFALAVLTTVLFIGSILAHELAHAAMFRARGIPVLGITLYMFGGLTQGGEEAKRPGDEFLVALVGPAATAALGGLFLLLHLLARGDAAHPWRSMFGYLALLNLIIAGFNLLPGFPLDGGRMLLAGMWKATGSRARGTTIAARVGQAIALVIGAYGLVDVARGAGLWGLWPIIIAVMLFQSSSAAVASTKTRTVLERATAAEVMSSPPPTVPADLQIAEAMERYLTGHEGEAFPVLDDGRVIGFISLRMARGVPLDRAVRDAMVGTDTVVVASPEEPMSDLAERMSGGQAQIVLVMNQGRLLGVIEPEDLHRYLRRRSGAGVAAPARPDLPTT